MRLRLIEATDAEKTNHGKFMVGALGAKDLETVSGISRQPLIPSLPVAGRFQTPLTPMDLFLLDLQTREGMVFRRDVSEEELERSFLIHPLHVCLLYYPLMRMLNRTKATPDTFTQVWVIPPEDLVKQPGLLVDRMGNPVRHLAEWSRRCPLVARFRNREPDGDQPSGGQSTLTPSEFIQMHTQERPIWKK